MQLPESLQQVLESTLTRVPVAELRRASAEMTKNYREGRRSAALFGTEAGRLAYLAARMPATYAAVHRVLREVSARLPEWQPVSLLDVGAGPGTAGWAAAECFPSLEQIAFVEQSSAMAELGQVFSSAASVPCLQQAKWLVQDVEQPLPAGSLAILSYVIGELPAKQVEALLDRIDAEVVVVIEPGTPAGFERILEVRKQAMERGAFLLAPCPHAAECPMKRPRWCHFAARVERSRIHKYLKEGSLGYEDEKMSYIAWGRREARPLEGRLVAPPQKGSGWVRLPLCHKEGMLREVTVSRKQESYRRARDVEWGDAWPM